MTAPDDRDLLWELPRAEAGDDAPAPEDGELRAYRAGTLAAPDETRVEWRLAGSRRGRERLAALAGVSLAAPPRRRVSVGLIGGAAALAAMIALALLVLPRPAPPLPPFDVRVEGLADTRDTAGPARAHASGLVRVRVEPKREARDGLRFAAYRLEVGALVRLSEPEVDVEVSRGSAVLTARADRLVGDAPGTRPFFVVVSERSLPERLRVATPEAAEERLREASQGQVHRVLLGIVEQGEDVR